MSVSWTSLALVVFAAACTAGHATAQQNIDALKQRCDDYGFVRGTPEHADCVRKLDVQQAQTRCQALVERGHQVCSKEFAEIVSPVDAATQCAQVQQAYQQYCQ